MALFSYQATNLKGEIIKGTHDATEEGAVVAYLQSEKLIPIKISKASKFSLSFAGSGKKIKYSVISIFTMELSTLLEAGLALDRSLSILVNMEEDPSWKSVLESLLDDVKSGKPLSDAMRKHDKIFDRFYISLIHAGEISGSMNVVLDRLADHMERNLETRGSIIKAIAYPLLLMIIGSGAILFLLTSVVPKFVKLAKNNKGEMPFLSDLIFMMSNVVIHYWYILAISVFVLIVWIRSWFSNEKSRAKMDAKLLKNKLTGSIVKNMELAKLSRTLGTMLTHGVPLVIALRSVKESVSNSVLRNIVDEAMNALKAGRSMSKVMIDSKQFPVLGVQMIKVGEETGKLEKMLLKVADIYDKEVKSSVDGLVSLIGPVAILLIAMMVAFIMIGLVMAIGSLKA